MPKRGGTWQKTKRPLEPRAGVHGWVRNASLGRAEDGYWIWHERQRAEDGAQASCQLNHGGAHSLLQLRGRWLVVVGKSDPMTRPRTAALRSACCDSSCSLARHSTSTTKPAGASSAIAASRCFEGSRM